MYIDKHKNSMHLHLNLENPRTLVKCLKSAEMTPFTFECIAKRVASTESSSPPIKEFGPPLRFITTNASESPLSSL